MRKLLILFVFLCLCIGALLFFNRNAQSPSQPPIVSNETNHTQSLSTLQDTATTNFTSSNATSNIVEQTNESFNAIIATNLQQWKTAIKGLTQLGGFKYNQDWIYEQHQTNSRASDRNAGIPIILSRNGKTITYTATFINLQTKNGSDNDLLESELYSSNMNIDQTRELGLQLCDMLQIDPNSFLAWCDKVGNHWLDAPLYGTRSNVPLSFKILMTYDNDKPWSIDFIMGSP
jgi:hypothetical protein